MVQVANNFLKGLFCVHDFYTVTNLYGDAIDAVSFKRTIRSVQQCRNCGKIKLSEFLDENCKIINYNIFFDKGKFRYVENKNNSTKHGAEN